MRKNVSLILLVAVCMMIFSCCAPAVPAAVTPESRTFSREDWDVCGFGLDVDTDDVESRFKTDGWLCGDGLTEPGKTSFWSEDTNIPGGRVSFSCDWYTGQQYKRLYTCQYFSVQVKGKEARVELPRGLKLGCTLEDVKNVFGLGESDGQGIYYGDGEDAPYAKIEKREYSPPELKYLCLAVPAGETGDSGYSYTCLLTLTINEKDMVSEFCYSYVRQYNILPGLPEPEQVETVRINGLGTEQPGKTMKFEEAIDLLACIQSAGQTPAAAEVMPTHTIEIDSGGKTYTLWYGDGLIAAPDGKAYEIGDIDEEMFFEDISELLTFVAVRNNSGLVVELTEHQSEEIGGLLAGMEECGGEEPKGESFLMTARKGDEYYNFAYHIGTNYVTYYCKQGPINKKLYSIGDKEAEVLTKIYHDIFGEENESPPVESEAPVTSPEVEKSPAPGESKEPLLPGLPSTDDITEVRIWHISEEGMVVIFTPVEAAELLDIIHAGSDKPFKGKLESPSHKILLKSGKGKYELTVGSNGIKAPNGKLYEVVFPERAALLYLFLEGDDN